MPSAALAPSHSRSPGTSLQAFWKVPFQQHHHSCLRDLSHLIDAFSAGRQFLESLIHRQESPFVRIETFSKQLLALFFSRHHFMPLPISAKDGAFASQGRSETWFRPDPMLSQPEHKPFTN